MMAAYDFDFDFDVKVGGCGGFYGASRVVIDFGFLGVTFGVGAFVLGFGWSMSGYGPKGWRTIYGIWEFRVYWYVAMEVKKMLENYLISLGF